MCIFLHVKITWNSACVSTENSLTPFIRARVCLCMPVYCIYTKRDYRLPFQSRPASPGVHISNTLREKHAQWHCGEYSHWSFPSCRTIHWQHLALSVYSIILGLGVKWLLSLYSGKLFTWDVNHFIWCSEAGPNKSYMLKYISFKIWTAPKRKKGSNWINCQFDVTIPMGSMSDWLLEHE